ncbi:MAG: hypothetical protein M3Y90_15785 [Actinomycetota bacterium]|nr:hypothetical protein [Actinomycetota bacterium]
MSTESELYTLTFWKTSVATAVRFAAASAAGVLTSTAFDGIKDAPWYGVLSAAAITGLIVMLVRIGGGAIRDIAPGHPTTTTEALASLRSTGRHAKPETDEPGA